MAILSSSLVFVLLLLRSWTRRRIAAGVGSPSTSQTSEHSGEQAGTEKELQMLRLEVQKLKLERQLLTNKQPQ